MDLSSGGLPRTSQVPQPKAAPLSSRGPWIPPGRGWGGYPTLQGRFYLPSHSHFRFGCSHLPCCPGSGVGWCGSKCSCRWVAQRRRAWAGCAWAGLCRAKTRKWGPPSHDCAPSVQPPRSVIACPMSCMTAPACDPEQPAVRMCPKAAGLSSLLAQPVGVTTSCSSWVLGWTSAARGSRCPPLDTSSLSNGEAVPCLRRCLPPIPSSPLGTALAVFPIQGSSMAATTSSQGDARVWLDVGTTVPAPWEEGAVPTAAWPGP